MLGTHKAGLALAALALSVPWPVAAATTSNGTMSMTVGFNGTPIPAGTCLWFNSVFKPSFAAGNSVTLYLSDCKLMVTPKGGSPVYYPVPDAQISFSPACTKAMTCLDAPTNTIVTTVPASFRDNVFLTGLAIPLPDGLTAGASATFTGTLRTNAPSGVTLQYQIAAAVYKQFSTDYNALGVKPTHGGPDCYPCGDQAGTPEAFAHYPKNVIGGGTGGGGGNYTGSYSATGSVIPVYNWTPPPPPAPDVSVSGSVSPATGSLPAIPDATIELLQNGSVVQTTRSGPDGSYLFTGVPAGTYTVRASAPDYNPNTSSGFTAASSDIAVPPIQLTPLPIAFLSDQEMLGKVFFAGFYGFGLPPGVTLTDANDFADLRNGDNASFDLSRPYQYSGAIPEFSQPGSFVIIQQPLLSPATDTSSFSNQVGVYSDTAGTYTYRFLISVPFTGPGTAHDFQITDVQFMTGGSWQPGVIATPPSVARTDGAAAPTPPPGDVPPGFTAQALAQITLPADVNADVRVDGSYTDVSGRVFLFSLTSFVGGGPGIEAQ